MVAACHLTGTMLQYSFKLRRPIQLFSIKLLAVLGDNSLSYACCLATGSICHQNYLPKGPRPFGDVLIDQTLPCCGCMLAPSVPAPLERDALGCALGPAAAQLPVALPLEEVAAPLRQVARRAPADKEDAPCAALMLIDTVSHLYLMAAAPNGAAQLDEAGQESP